MKLGWIRAPKGAARRLAPQDHSALIKAADNAGLDQIWLDGFSIDHLSDVPSTDTVRIGCDLTQSCTIPTGDLADKIRAAQERFGDRLIVGFGTSPRKADRAALERIETLLGDERCNVLPSHLPISPPRPSLVLRPAEQTHPDLRRAASSGFQALSPAWEPVPALARHWSDIVTGATHAARRARPDHWHLARLIFVSDSPAAIAAWRDGLVREYLAAAMPSGAQTATGSLTICGSAEEVADQIADLRRRVGPFGVLHCLDPGLDAKTATSQMDRLATEILPILHGRVACQNTKELEIS